MKKPSNNTQNKRLGILVVVLAFLGGYGLFLWLYNMDEKRGLDDYTLSRLKKEDAARAVDVAKTDYGVELDYSPESIKQVEQILSQLHHRHLEKPFSESQQTKLYVLWGAYVGEVVRDNINCTWRVGPGLPLQLEDETLIYPTDWCRQKFLNDRPEDFLWSQFQALVKDN